MLILQLVTMTTVHTCSTGTTKLGTTCRRALKNHWMLPFVCSSLIWRFRLNKSQKTYTLPKIEKRIATYQVLCLDASAKISLMNLGEIRGVIIT